VIPVAVDENPSLRHGLRVHEGVRCVPVPRRRRRGSERGSRPKWSLVRCDQLSFLATAMHGLLLAVPPAGPDQHRGLGAREPTVPRPSFLGQRDANQTVVQVLLGMMVDRGAQRFQISMKRAVLYLRVSTKN